MDWLGTTSQLSRRITKAGGAIASLCCFIFLLSAVMFGQTNQGSIAGNVVDPSGALVPNAKLTATNKSTGAVYETVSSSSGSYRFTNLSIGTYDVKASAPGFKETTSSGVVVQVATISSLEIKLSAGGSNETVVVAADAPTVQTDSQEIGGVVTQKQTLDLPLALGSTVQAMRSPEAFAFLIPGTVGPGSDSGNGGTFESKISGGQNYATEVLLDGAATTRSENGSSFDETAPSVEALSEFKVITSTLPAQYGRTTGGVESFNTKGGTNSFHGTLYELFRNEALDANTWGNNFILATSTDPAARKAAQRPLDRQNDYGGAIGGPVIIPKLYHGRDKTFFFASWEQYRQTVGGVTTSTVPTAAERTGDFSALLNTGHVLGTNPCNGQPIFEGQIFDPATTQTVGGVQCRTPFAGNIIPSTRFSTVGQKLLSFYPAPQNSGAINNLIFPFSFPILDTTLTFRIDQNMSVKGKAFFSYSSRGNTRISTTPQWADASGYGRSQAFTTHYMRFGYDYTISPTKLNHFVIGYNRTNSKNVGAGVTMGNGTDWDKVLGITGTSGTMFPAIAAGEASTANFGDNVYGDTIDNGFRFSDTFTMLKGKHQFTFGYEQWYQQYSPLNFQNTSGSFNFGRGQTAGTPNTSNLSGNGIASMLLGQLASANVTAYASQPRYTSDYYAGFFEDNFKLWPTLTINLGLRYEVDRPRKETRGNTSNIDLAAPNPGAGGLPGVLVFAGEGTGRNGNVNERWADTWMKDFGPRIGFAWSPAMFNNKTAFRGGYGIIYGGLQYADFGGFNRTGFQANPQFNSVDGFSPAFQIDSGLPAFAAPPNLDPTQLNFAGPQYVDPSFGRPPMIQNWSLDVQQELARDLILDVAYVGQHSTHLRTNYNATNTLDPKYFSLGNTLFAPISSPQAAAAGITAPYAGFPGGSIVAQALVPFPQYFGFNTDGTLENFGQSTYNALQAQLTRRFHNGLNLMASYTWSKTLTNADAALPFFATLHQGGAPQNPFNKKGDKAISNQDLPQNLVISYIYELPFGKGKRFANKGGVVDRVVGGWSISGIQRYESGQPIAFACATGVPAFAGCIRFNRIAGQSLYSNAWSSGNFNPITDPVFNAAALSDPNSAANVAAQGFTFGNLPRVTGEARMGAYMSEDFNFLKRTKITEGSNVLLQVSMINAFNRHIWNRPSDLNPFDPSFGRIDVFNYSTTGGGGYLLGPRKVQLQLKIEF
jgi:hypothetical protein